MNTSIFVKISLKHLYSFQTLLRDIYNGLFWKKYNLGGMFSVKTLLHVSFNVPPPKWGYGFDMSQKLAEMSWLWPISLNNVYLLAEMFVFRNEHFQHVFKSKSEMFKNPGTGQTALFNIWKKSSEQNLSSTFVRAVLVAGLKFYAQTIFF